MRTPDRLLVAALLCGGVGALLSGGASAGLLAAGFALGIAALVTGAEGVRRRIAWLVTVASGLALLIVFTLQMAAPNVIIAGQKASERMAVATLRTILWAQDQMISLHGRAGLIGELSGARGVGGGETPMTVPLLRSPFKDLKVGQGGEVAQFSGYTFAIHVRGTKGAVTDGAGFPSPGATRWIGYAWPAFHGRSGKAAFCINEHEDILQSPNPQAYSGIERMPAWDACRVGEGERLVPGTGRDGAEWTRWRGKQTRRARGK